MKTKKKIIASVCLLVSLLMLSTTAFAGVRSESFGQGGSIATARISAKNAFVEAYTMPSTSYNTISVQTRALYEKYVGSTHEYCATSWDYGQYYSGGVYAVVDAPTLSYAGESNHSIDGFTKYLYCSYG